MKTLRLIAFLVAVIAMFVRGQTIATAATGATKKTSTLQTIRSADAPLMQLIEQGFAHSATLRRLQAHLADSPVIVYLSRVTLPRGLWGRTRIIGSGDAWRFLSIEIDDRISLLDQVSTIGHELQHAVEIADAGDAVDAGTLATLYRRIGHESPQIDRDPGAGKEFFETEEARDAGHRVRAELTGWL